MQRVVPDASVLLKWVLPGDRELHREQALELRKAVAAGRVEVRVPALWYFEVGNTLARKYPQDARGRLADLRAFRLMEIAMGRREEEQILRLTGTFAVTFYDASYHALAIVNDGVFVTADEKYLQAVAGEPNLLHLKDWH
ncbi:MAG: type II toxin-antitoxin system VapC family toxin [Methylococcaceae bacterium]|nr:type II toxin-antitoxin system VapC family toxin [Methylococcaceae bacterium]